MAPKASKETPKADEAKMDNPKTLPKSKETQKPSEKKTLPALESFPRSAEALGSLTAEKEATFTKILLRNRFRQGPEFARAMSNVIILFRLLLFFADFDCRSPKFWELMESCWDICHFQEHIGHAQEISDYYVRARKIYLDANGAPTRDSLLGKLVDEWTKYQTVPLPNQDGKPLDWTARNKEWVHLRNNFVDFMLDSTQPLRMVGVEPAPKKWTNTYDDETLTWVLCFCRLLQ